VATDVIVTLPLVGTPLRVPARGFFGSDHSLLSSSTAAQSSTTDCSRTSLHDLPTSPVLNPGTLLLLLLASLQG
jgi:hypothetical protein